MEQLIDVARRERPKMIYLANPDNPSGTFIEPEVVAALRDALQPDQILALDEAYADFVPPEKLDRNRSSIRKSCACGRFQKHMA